MSEPTLMNPNPDRSDSASPRNSTPTTPDRLNLANIRVVDVEGADGSVERFDCYASGGTKKLFRIDGETVQVRVLEWARSRDMDAEPEVQWTDTGLLAGDVDQIRVFGWPKGERIQTYEDIGE